MRLLLLIVYFLSAAFRTATPSLEDVRAMYVQSVADEKQCELLLKMLSTEESSSDATLLGYKGCTMMLMAKHLINPFRKYNYFVKGKEILEAAIKIDQNNVELHYLRLGVQVNAPRFLGYNKDIDADKTMLLNSVNTINDANLKSAVISFLKQSCYVSNCEKQKL